MAGTELASMELASMELAGTELAAMVTACLRPRRDGNPCISTLPAIGDTGDGYVGPMHNLAALAIRHPIVTLLLTAVLLAPAMRGQDEEQTYLEHNRITVRNDGSPITYTFRGAGMHLYGGTAKAGGLVAGVYTTWHPQGWKNVEIAFTDGVKVTVFDAKGNEKVSLQSEGLEVSWHANGRQAFGSDDGHFAFWDEQGMRLVDIRICQDVWRAWGTEVEVDEWSVWSELLYAQHVVTLLPIFVAGLAHQDDWIRVYACDAIATLDEDAATAVVPALRQALTNDVFWLVRERAAWALMRLGAASAEAMPDLIETVRRSDEHETTRRYAAAALATMGERAAVAVPALEEMAKKAKPSLQVYATAALGWIDPANRGTSKRLAGYLNDTRTALAAAESLLQMGSLAKPAQDKIETALAAYGEELSSPALALSEVLFGLDSSARQPAWFLPEMAEPKNRISSSAIEPVAVFVWCMMQPHSEPLENLVETLASCENKWLQTAFVDYVDSVGPEAMSAVPALVGLLASGWSNTQTWSQRALVRIGQPAIPALVKALAVGSDGQLSKSSNALSALVDIGAPAIAAIADTLNHPQSYLAIQAAEALGRMGATAKDALPSLKQALTHQDPELREAAAVAIARISGSTRSAPR